MRLVRRFGDDRGQTIGIYIVAMSALFFLAFAFFAVGQATVTRNGAQTAADAAALAAAREARDEVKDAFLSALTGGDLDALGRLLTVAGTDDGPPCAAAGTYAGDNDAELTGCDRVNGPPGYTVDVKTHATVGRSVIDGTEDRKAEASATAVVEPRCVLADNGSGGDSGGATDGATDGGSGGSDAGGTAGATAGADAGSTAGSTAGTGTPSPPAPNPVDFTCDGSLLTIDPGADGFTLNLSDFYSVHLSK